MTSNQTKHYNSLRVTLILLTVLLIFTVRASHAQNADSMYIASKNIGFKGEYEIARAGMEKVLQVAPDYYDARVFIARTFSWQSKYAESKHHLNLVLNQDPKNLEALDALIDALRWPGETDSAMIVCKKAQQYYPDEERFKVKETEIIKQQTARKFTVDQLKADSFYTKGRELAFKSKFTEARVLLDSALGRDPKLFEASILKGCTFSWQQKYSEARPILDKVLKEDTVRARRKEALSARADIEVYDLKHKTAQQKCDTALKEFPNAVEFRKKKSIAYANDEYYKEAIAELKIYLDSVKTDTQAINMMRDFEYKSLRNHAAAGWVQQIYNYSFAPWSFGFVEYGRKFRKAQSIARINYAQRFKTEALQFEIDNYIKLYKGTMLFVNAGISSRNIMYPRYRFGAELYKSFLKKFDASAGYHFLRYDFDETDANNITVRNTKNIHMLVGSLGFYHKKFWLSYRPIIVLNAYGKGTTTITHNFQTRYYYKSELDYINFTVLYGNGIVGLNYTTPITYNLIRLSTLRFGADWQTRLSKTITGGLGVWWDYDEYVDGRYRYRYSFSANIKKVF